MNRYLLTLFVGWSLGLLIVNCRAGWDDVSPAAMARSADYPCGAIGTTCELGDGGDWHGAVCCWDGNACIKDSLGTGVGYRCENDRDLRQGPIYGASRDGGTRASTPATRMP